MYGKNVWKENKRPETQRLKVFEQKYILLVIAQLLKVQEFVRGFQLINHQTIRLKVEDYLHQIGILNVFQHWISRREDIKKRYSVNRKSLIHSDLGNFYNHITEPFRVINLLKAYSVPQIAEMECARAYITDAPFLLFSFVSELKCPTSSPNMFYSTKLRLKTSARYKISFEYLEVTYQSESTALKYPKTGFPKWTIRFVLPDVVKLVNPSAKKFKDPYALCVSAKYYHDEKFAKDKKGELFKVSENFPFQRKVYITRNLISYFAQN